MRKTYNVFLIAQYKDQEYGNPIYEALNKYALELTTRGIEYIKVWDFDKIPSIHSLLTLENEFNLPLLSKAFVFVEKALWIKSNYSKFTRIQIVDCVPKSEPMLLWMTEKSSGVSIQKKPFNPTPLTTVQMKLFFSSYKLNDANLIKYKQFFDYQQEFFKKKTEEVKIVDVPYSKLIPFFIKLNVETLRNMKFFVVSSEKSLVLPPEMELISPEQLDTWKYTGSLDVVHDYRQYPEIFFSEFENNAPKKATQKFVEIYSGFFSEFGYKFSVVPFKDLVSTIKRNNGNLGNREPFVITSNPNLNVPKGVQLILSNHFDEWDYKKLP